jgi:hypothetical protein
MMGALREVAATIYHLTNRTRPSRGEARESGLTGLTRNQVSPCGFAPVVSDSCRPDHFWLFGPLGRSYRFYRSARSCDSDRSRPLSGF